MAETNAVFGGEHSGHYYYRDNFRADSGIITALLVLELLSLSDQPLSELLKPFQRYSDSGELNTEVTNPAATVEAIAAHEDAQNASVDRLDGLTGRPRRVVVQPATLEHRATPPSQRRGEDAAALSRGARGRGARADCDLRHSRVENQR